MLNFTLALLITVIAFLGFTTAILYRVISVIRSEQEAAESSPTPLYDKMKAEFAKGFEGGIVNIPSKKSINQATPEEWDQNR